MRCSAHSPLFATIGAKSLFRVSTKRSIDEYLKRRCATDRQSTAFPSFRRPQSIISVSPFTTRNFALFVTSPRAGMSVNEFIFEHYRYDPTDASLSLHYRFDQGEQFEERLVFDFPVRPLSGHAEEVLDRIFRMVFLLSGVSYYKPFVPEILRCEAFPLDQQTASFLRKFYEQGLGEFAWKNRITLNDRCQFLWEPLAPPAPLALELPRRTCVPVGGGKDSIVTLECLKAGNEDLVLFSLGDAEPIAACVAAAELPFFRVRRRLDPGVIRLNDQGALNGHVPITGILSSIVLACAVLAGFDTIAMS